MNDLLSNSYLGLLFDTALALLLIATIAYAAILNRKLTELRGAKQDMEKLLAGFANSTERAEVSLRALREASGETGERLQEDIVKGNALADDLVFLIERGGTLADRLDTTRAPVGRTSGPERGTPAHRAGNDPVPAKVAPDVEGPESAFIEALRGVR